MLNWTYGGVAVTCLSANPTAPNNFGFNREASYARVFEHEIPGLGNRYIMLLMVLPISNQRNIHWAHSENGIDWIAVRDPLVRPLDNIGPVVYPDVSYTGSPGGGISGSNLSGPFFHVMEDESGTLRYLVTAHSSSGHIHLFEVGESFNRELHWGTLYHSTQLEQWPDHSRAAAPYFFTDGDGVMHMFYEAGRRTAPFRTNITHALGTYTITYSASEHGTVTGDDPPRKPDASRGTLDLNLFEDPEGSVVRSYMGRGIPEQFRRIFTITPDCGYELAQILVNDVDILEAGIAFSLVDGADEGTKYFSLADVLGNSTIHIIFKEIVITPTITGASTSARQFVGISETSRNSRNWRLTFTAEVFLSNDSSEQRIYSIELRGNNANMDGKYVFGEDHDLEGYTLTYDIKGNGSNIKVFFLTPPDPEKG